MNFIEIQGVKKRRRFVNLDSVVRIDVLEEGSFKLSFLGQGFGTKGPEVVKKGQKGYQELLELLKITHSPASGTSQLE